MEQATTPETQTNVVPGYEMDEAQKAVLMAPLLKELREQVLNQELYEKLEGQIPNPHPSIPEDKLTEQIVFGLLAHVKYNLPLEECITIANDGQAVNWCFDKFFHSEDFKKVTESMHTLDGDGVSISHNVDTNDIAQIAQILRPLIIRFNKEAKKSVVLYQKLNYFTIKVKQSLTKHMPMTQKDGFQAGCGCILFKYYGMDQEEALQLAIKGEAAKTVFELYMKQEASKAITPAEEAEEAVIH